MLAWFPLRKWSSWTYENRRPWGEWRRRHEGQAKGCYLLRGYEEHPSAAMRDRGGSVCQGLPQEPLAPRPARVRVQGIRGTPAGICWRVSEEPWANVLGAAEGRCC